MTLSISTEPGATLACTLDGSPSSCVTLTGLAGGSHTLSVTATDAAGNTGPATSVTWTVDATPPDTTITSAPPNPTNATAATFTLASSKPGSTAECNLDNAGFVPCSASPSFTSLNEGSHTLLARAIDAYGNVDPTPASYTWTIDLTAPVAPTISGLTDPSNVANPSVTFTSEAGATFQCSLDGSAYAACSSPLSIGPLADGSHTFSVQATDAAGQRQPRRELQLDGRHHRSGRADGHLRPVQPEQHRDSELLVHGRPGLDVPLRVDSDPFVGCSSPYTSSPRSAPGATPSTSSRSTRPATRASQPTSARGSPTSCAPNAPTIASGPPTTTPLTDATFVFSSDEPTATLQCDLDGAGYQRLHEPRRR